MKYLPIVLLLISTNAVADESPYDKFTADNNFTTDTSVVWTQAKDINKACNAESKRLGNNGFPYKLDACSFRTKDKYGKHTCHIMTSTTMDYWTLGHELRHCFQTDWHS